MSDSTDELRDLDLSEIENTGAPRKMRATCQECGHVSVGGRVGVWLNIHDGKSTPRKNVSYLCPGCNRVTDRKVEILERWSGSSE